MATPEPLAVGKCFAGVMPETWEKLMPADLATSAKRKTLGSWGISGAATAGTRLAKRSPDPCDCLGGVFADGMSAGGLAGPAGGEAPVSSLLLQPALRATRPRQSMRFSRT